MQVTAFPRKRAAAERHGVMLDNIMHQLAQAFGADAVSDSQLLTLR
jgi:hypothetical protein